MTISVDDQMSSDFDWYCVDESGEIGHFTTAGFKLLPSSVAQNAEDRLRIIEHFNSELRTTSDCLVDGQLPSSLRNSERYLQSFLSMAEKGLYSFDIDSYLGPNICYFRVAVPVQPLRVENLPADIRTIVEKTVLSSMLLRNSATIPYAQTLEM